MVLQSGGKVEARPKHASVNALRSLALSNTRGNSRPLAQIPTKLAAFDLLLVISEITWSGTVEEQAPIWEVGRKTHSASPFLARRKILLIEIPKFLDCHLRYENVAIIATMRTLF